MQETGDLFSEAVETAQDVLADLAPHAQRMARALHRWRAMGEMAPVSLQAVPRFGASRVAERIVQFLSIRFNEGFAMAWSETG